MGQKQPRVRSQPPLPIVIPAQRTVSLMQSPPPASMMRRSRTVQVQSNAIPGIIPSSPGQVTIFPQPQYRPFTRYPSATLVHSHVIEQFPAIPAPPSQLFREAALPPLTSSAVRMITPATQEGIQRVDPLKQSLVVLEDSRVVRAREAEIGPQTVVSVQSLPANMTVQPPSNQALSIESIGSRYHGRIVGEVPSTVTAPPQAFPTTGGVLIGGTGLPYRPPSYSNLPPPAIPIRGTPLQPNMGHMGPFHPPPYPMGYPMGYPYPRYVVPVHQVPLGPSAPSPPVSLDIPPPVTPPHMGETRISPHLITTTQTESATIRRSPQLQIPIQLPIQPPAISPPAPLDVKPNEINAQLIQTNATYNPVTSAIRVEDYGRMTPIGPPPSFIQQFPIQQSSIQQSGIRQSAIQQSVIQVQPSVVPQRQLIPINLAPASAIRTNSQLYDMQNISDSVQDVSRSRLPRAPAQQYSLSMGRDQPSPPVYTFDYDLPLTV